MSSEIQVFDFFKNKFAGDQRQAHQFIPYVYGKLSAKGIQWILNESKHPTPMVNPLTIMAARADERMQEQVSKAYQADFQNFLRSITEWERVKLVIVNHPDNLNDQQRLLTDLAIHDQSMPIEPVLVMPEEKDFKCKPSDHIKMEKISEKKLKFISVAAEAIQVILEYISVDMKTSLADLLGNQEIDERVKLINIWEWLETFRVDNSSIVGEVQQDMHNLSQIDTFAEAMLRIKDMNILQHELKVMKQPYTDRELIVIHAGKLRGDVFKEVNYKWLQQSTRPTHSKPSLSRTTQPVPSVAAKLDWSWDDYCDDISRYNNTDNTVRTKSTVLVSKVESSRVCAAVGEDEIEAKVMALYHQRFGTNPTPPHNSPGFVYHPTSRHGRWNQHQKQPYSQFPQTSSPYVTQYADQEIPAYKSQIPVQSPYRSQIPRNSPSQDTHQFTRSTHPPRSDQNPQRGRFNDRRKRPETRFSPSKRAYTAYVEEFNAQEPTGVETSILSYEEFVCDNAVAFSARPIASEDIPVNDSNVTYWDENSQEIDSDAAEFFASLGAK